MAENRIEEVYPYLRTRNANAAIEFYKRAFGAVEDFRLTEPSGRVGHAELKFGETTVMVSDEYPEYGIHGPKDDAPRERWPRGARHSGLSFRESTGTSATR